jgi:hypothetical protein
MGVAYIPMGRVANSLHELPCGLHSAPFFDNVSGDIFQVPKSAR